jgi:hypothetical protein
LFEDGALREGNALGALIEPPGDPHLRAKRIRIYHEVMLERSVQAFHDQKTKILQIAKINLKAQFCGSPPVDVGQAEAELKQLRATAKKCKSNLDKARDAEEAAKPERLRERERQDVANRAANSALIDRLNKIEV